MPSNDPTFLVLSPDSTRKKRVWWHCIASLLFCVWNFQLRCNHTVKNTGLGTNFVGGHASRCFCVLLSSSAIPYIIRYSTYLSTNVRQLFHIWLSHYPMQAQWEVCKRVACCWSRTAGLFMRSKQYACLLDWELNLIITIQTLIWVTYITYIH